MNKRKRRFICAALAAMCIAACSASDTADNCAELQKQCIDSGMCLDSSNQGKSKGGGEYGDTIGGVGSDEAACSIRCVRCEGADDAMESDSNDGGDMVPLGTGGSALPDDPAQSTGGVSAAEPPVAAGAAGTTVADGGPNHEPAVEWFGGACGLRSAVGECTTCLEAQGTCCEAAMDCAQEPDCVAMWECYQGCELSGAQVSCSLECRNTVEAARSTRWGSLHNCLAQRCATGTEAYECPAFAL